MQSELKVRVLKSIVVEILQEMLLEEGTFRIESVFKPVLDSEMYEVTVKNKQNFEIVVGQVMLGGSFRFVQRSIARMKSQGSLSYVGSISEADIAKFIQCLTAISLQYISELISSDDVWGYSIAFDAGSNHGDSFVDVRVRFYKRGKIHNFHLLAIPLRVRHTGENMALSVVRLLEGMLGGDWSDKMVGNSSDGAASMVGRVSGAVTRIEGMVTHSLYRVWCGAHQLDLAVQDAFSNSMKSIFQEPLHALISYLRRQTNLKQQMGTVCPTVSTTRWLSIGEVCKWLISNRCRIQLYLEEKQSSAAPEDHWWMLIYAVNNVMSEVNGCFRLIQGRDALLQEQNDRFQGVLNYLKTPLGFEVLSSSMDVLLAASDTDVIGQRDSIILKRSKIVQFIELLGSYPTKIFDEMEKEELDDLLKSFDGFLLNLYQNISNLVVMRDSCNAPSNRKAPPVLPSELKAMTPREFYAFVELRKPQLRHSVDEQIIEHIEEQFICLRTLDLPSASEGTDFLAAWKPLGAKFNLLQQFCGALASVFPTTAPVESDLSVINVECDDQRRSLSLLSIAGILHSKQWDELKHARAQ